MDRNISIVGTILNTPLTDNLNIFNTNIINITDNINGTNTVFGISSYTSNSSINEGTITIGSSESNVYINGNLYYNGGLIYKRSNSYLNDVLMQEYISQI